MHLISKAGRAILGVFAVSVIAFLFAAAAPLAVSAAPAIRDFSMNRSSVAQGQSITFTIETTSDARYVFATADGVRTQGTRSSGNTWTITVNPSRTTVVNIFANSANNESNAARMSVPITVGAAGTAGSAPAAPTITLPPAPTTLGPVEIHHVAESPATAAGFVQLTVVTGSETNDVWVNFDRVANQRGTGRFARGTMLSQGAHYRVWTVNFRPATWATQRVEIGSNRTYNWPGADSELFDLTLAHPFVPPSNPLIRNVTVNNRSVGTNANVTFNIRTNDDVEYVWIRTIEGNEYLAHRVSGAGADRNWSVTFNPRRSGNVQIFANWERNESGAVRRTENITVGQQSARFLGSPSAQRLDNSRIRIEARTNEHANAVWVEAPNGNRIHLSRTNTASGERTWTVTLRDSDWDWNWGGWNQTTVYVSSQTGQRADADDSRTVSVTGSGWGDDWWDDDFVDIFPGRTQTINRGSQVTFTVRAHSNQMSITNENVVGFDVWSSSRRSIGDGRSEWTVTVSCRGGTSSSTTVRLNFGGGTQEWLTVNVRN